MAQTQFAPRRIRAWITNGVFGPDDLDRAGDKVAEILSYTNSDMSKVGWTPVGHADIAVAIDDQNTLVSNKIDALRKEVANVRAEAAEKVTRMERQINELLALPMSGGEAS